MSSYCSTCQNYVEDDPCAVCEGTENNHVYYVPDFRKRNTNADRIRAMTDEGLAEWFHNNTTRKRSVSTYKRRRNDV